jgi:outer membrane protein OmpA-like peptidoglycan-associated protein
MIETRWRWLAVLGCTATLVSACASSHKSASAPELPGQAMVALLPDPDTNAVGKAYVSNASGRVDLMAARDVTTVSARSAPQPVSTLSAADVRALFGDALAALPPAQKHFTLFFRFDSEELTDESRALAPDIIRAVRERPVPDVLVVGHTDTTGTRPSNFALGLRRAKTVRNLLHDSGLAVSAIDVVSHGETELLVPTGNGIFEARNRRVEITVR